MLTGIITVLQCCDGGGGEVIKFNDVVAIMSCLNVLSEDTTAEKVLGTLSTSFVGPS